MTALRIAALFGFLAVALGAFGAHGLHPTLAANNRVATWETGAHYHLIHSVVMLAIALALPAEAATPLAFWFFVAGVTIFSGTLYILSITNVGWWGAITPIGGVCLLIGWALLAFRGLK